MRSLEEKLLAVDDLFRRGSKGHQCAVEVVRKGGRISMNERPLICEKIGCSEKTLETALTRLRKAGLYGSTDEPTTTEKPRKPQEVESINEEPKTPFKEEPAPKVEDEEFEESEEKYVTREDFNQFVKELKVVMGLNPVEDVTEVEHPGYLEDQYEAPTPESVDLEEASFKQMGTWIEHKNMIYFDFARNGAFGGALEGFGIDKKGKKIPPTKLWSDFVNIVIDDYFKIVHNVGLGLLSRRFA